MTGTYLRPVLIGIVLALASAMAATAQPPGQQTGAMNGLTLNRDQPVKIESNSLEVRDKTHQATFFGDVKLVQGETTLKCNTLVVFYDDNAAPAPSGKKAKVAKQETKSPGAAGGQQIKRVEAKGNVFITQKDQTGAGELAIYDLKTNSITLTGNVVVTQGQNVLRGERMVVDMTTGITRVEAGKPGSRVEMLAQPGAAPGAAPPGPVPGAAKDAKATPAPPPAAKSHPARPAIGAPTRIN